ncbi:unnamed protein product [Hymenolepis diminuta]|uniref:FSA_C domain-containing protein n=1 Tax=Hymenolepis diminuta TaxID=6216 RepID=A0A0R3SAD3_HYMDI|nr:unnamed protein product [Hymenolepis diminuta]
MKAEVLEIVEGMRFAIGLNDLMQTVMNFTVKSLPKGSCKITITMTSRKNNFLSNSESSKDLSDSYDLPPPWNSGTRETQVMCHPTVTPKALEDLGKGSRNTFLPSIDVQKSEHWDTDRAFAPDDYRAARSDGRPRLDKNFIIPTVRMSFYNWMLKSLLKLKASVH